MIINPVVNHSSVIENLRLLNKSLNLNMESQSQCMSFRTLENGSEADLVIDGMVERIPAQM